MLTSLILQKKIILKSGTEYKLLNVKTLKVSERTIAKSKNCSTLQHQPS